MLIIYITMCINIWKTVCSEKNIPVLLKFCLGYYLALWKTLRLVLLIKKSNIQTRANSTFNVDQGNFLANYTARLLFGLYV